MPLFEDRNAQSDQPIPKRPPHDLMWAEWNWREGDDNDFTDWTIGAVIRQVNVNGEEFVKQEEQIPPQSRKVILGPGAEAALGSSLRLSEESRKMIRDSIACHQLDMFVRINNSSAPDMKQSMRDNRIAQRMGHYLVFFGEGYQTARHVWRMPCNQQEMNNQSIFKLPAVMSIYEESNPLCSPWPMEMCFSLLHCRNVVTETVNPTPKQIRAAHREHRAPDRSYKIIRLERPVRRADASDDGESESETVHRRQRFHLVRGHFKNLQADRYVNKGWHWWPEHWRGDEKLGTVKTVSVLKP